MEIEAIVGNALRTATRLKVGCPYWATVYALLKLRNLKLQNS
ncbi:MAG: ketopantoate reductase C-terminal domain-containing protein [Methylovulum sp.]|nr:ketopantoate reductase C-terminal domain-containing protein [Methylovulum sp.]MDD2723405.1 ketopantoate reductase C-terminal domain-containing protein [Methylovulum sp.]